MNKLGSLESISEMIPIANKTAKNPLAIQTAEKEMKKYTVIIDSMTLKERRNHTILNGNRRKRIAKGSGTRVEDINKMIKNYMQMQKMMKNMGKTGRLAKKMMNYF